MSLSPSGAQPSRFAGCFVISWTDKRRREKLLYVLTSFLPSIYVDSHIYSSLIVINPVFKINFHPKILLSVRRPLSDHILLFFTSSIFPSLSPRLLHPDLEANIYPSVLLCLNSVTSVWAFNMQVGQQYLVITKILDILQFWPDDGGTWKVNGSTKVIANHP